MTEKLERSVEIEPAYDKRNFNLLRNYGIGGCKLFMLLKGSSGVVYFLIRTNWQLPHVTKEFIEKPVLSPLDIEVRFLPGNMEIGYHSPVPRSEGQTPTTFSCEFLGMKTCFHGYVNDGRAKMFETLLTEGSDGVWRRLEEYYKEIFGNDEEL